jgi:perosamine synthetase
VRLRHLPPAAAPLSATDLWSGVVGLLQSRRAVERLQCELASALRVKHVFLVSSGRAGLALILRALQRLSPRRNVVVPAYTCFSVPAAVMRAGLKVTACDIDPTTFDFDHDQLEALVSETEPLCVVSTHLFGFHADVRRAEAICRPHGAFVVDDAAQAFGVRTRSGALGTLGDVGFFSFGRGKAVTSIRGGAVVTDSADVARELAREYAALDGPGLMRGLGTLVEAAAVATLLRPALYWLPASLPFLKLGETVYSTAFPMQRLSGVEAGLLRHWERRLALSDEARAERVAALRRWVPSLNGEGARACIRLPLVCASKAERDRLYAASQRERLGFSLMYPTAISAIPALRNVLDGRKFPNAERMAEQLLTVPVHPLVSSEDRQAIERLLTRAGLASECA